MFQPSKYTLWPACSFYHLLPCCLIQNSAVHLSWCELFHVDCFLHLTATQTSYLECKEEPLCSHSVAGNWLSEGAIAGNNNRSLHQGRESGLCNTPLRAGLPGSTSLILARVEYIYLYIDINNNWMALPTGSSDIQWILCQMASSKFQSP